jgi:aminopeptidase-like protein
MVRECLEVLENEPVLTATQIGEPQLGRRGLYHLIMGKSIQNEVMLRTDILAYSDGQHSVVDMSELFDLPVDTLEVMIQELVDHDLIRRHHQSNRIRAGELD